MANWVRELEKRIKPVYLVSAFIILILVGFCHEAKANVTVEVGAGFLSGQYSEGQVLFLSEQFDKYSIGIGYIAEQYVVPRVESRTFINENLFLQGMRHVRLGNKWELGVGVAYFNSINRALGSKFNAALLVRFKPSDRLSFNIRHYSNAGSGSPNMGQDMVTVGYNF